MNSDSNVMSEAREEKCREVKYGSSFAEEFATIAGEVDSIPINENAIGIVTGVVPAVNHVTKKGMDIAHIALGCTTLPIEEIKELIDIKVKDGKRMSEKQTGVMDLLSNMIAKFSNEANRMRRDMEKDFKTVLEKIDSPIYKKTLSNIQEFTDYFLSEQKRMRDLSKEDYITELEKENGVLDILFYTKMPSGISLHVILFDIMHHKMAMPKDKNDTSAFQALYSLLYGTQTYIAVFGFLTEAHSYLIDHYYHTGNLEKFNMQVDKIIKVQGTFQNALVSDNVGFISSLIDTVNSIGDLMKNTNNVWYNEVKDRSFFIEKIKSEISTLTLPLIHLSPEKPTLEFKGKEVHNFGKWKKGATVKYAVQYEKNGWYSKVGEWSDSLLINQKICPFVITDARHSDKKKIIFRQFSDGSVQIAATIEAPEIETRDVHRDLYDVVTAEDPKLGLAVANEAINHGARGDMKFELGRTALHAACENENTDVIIRIMQLVAFDFNARDHKGYSPFHYCAETQNLLLLTLYSEKGADINARTYVHRYTPLHVASRLGNKKVVDKLLHEIHVDVNVKDEYGISPLHWASKWGKDLISSFISSYKVNANIQSNIGLSPLHLMAINGELGNFQYSSGSGHFDLNTVDMNNMSSLHYAALLCNKQVLGDLLHFKEIDPNIASDGNKWTPLHFAIFFKKEDCAIELIKNEKVDVTLKAHGDVTPLHLAIATGQPEIINELLKKNLNIEEKSDKGYTALHVASMRNDMNIITNLISKGADKNAQTKCYDTAYDLVKKFYPDVVNPTVQRETQKRSTHGSYLPESANASGLYSSYREIPNRKLLVQDNNFQPIKGSSFQNIDGNGTLLLLDVLLRKLTNQRYGLHESDEMPDIEVNARALTITENFVDLLNTFSDTPPDEELNLAEMYGRVKKALMSGRGIVQVLCSYAQNFSTLKAEDRDFLLRKLTSNYPTSIGLTDNLKDDFFSLLEANCFP